ncbi:hypothetical protein QUA21_04860, partial [Microcoleus sp. Pol1B3]
SAQNATPSPQGAAHDFKSSAQNAAEFAKPPVPDFRSSAQNATPSPQGAAHDFKSSAQNAAESAKRAAHDVKSSAQYLAESAEENKDSDLHISGSPELKHKVVINDKRIIKD